MSTSWRSRNQSEKTQNTAWAWISKTTALKIYSMDSSSSVREYVCVAHWGWRIIFIKNAMQEVIGKLKNWKYAAVRKEIFFLKKNNNVDWNNFLRSMIRNHAQWAYSSAILTHRAVMTYQRSSSSSYYLEFKKVLPRSWKTPKYTREYEYSWKRFWSSTCSTRLWWIIQLFKKFGNTIGNRQWCKGLWEEKESRKVGAKNHCNQYLYLAFR